MPAMEDDGASASPSLSSSATAPRAKLMAARERSDERRESHLPDQWQARCQRLLQAATIAVFAYLCVGEFLPQSLTSAGTNFSGQEWARQEVLLLAALSFLVVALASTSSGRGCSGCSGRGFEPGAGGTPSTAFALLAVLNIVPIVVVLGSTLWISRSDNCPASAYDGAPSEKETNCNYLATLLDVVGLMSARLARFDLGVSLILATRGDSGWLLRATGGWLGLPEAVPIHRVAGWWCVGQSALHSSAYLVFYLLTGGLKSLWFNCFPVALPSGGMNRLGLVNFFGVVAVVAMLPLVLPSLPYLRRRSYHIFQRLHLPAAVLFVICCALHDLPILMFAVPGIADWYLGWRNMRSTSALFPAKARLLPGTSGPWVELTIDCSDTGNTSLSRSAKGRERGRQPLAPRGEWALVRVLPIGREAHPLSVAVSNNGTRLSALVAAGAGDWSASLAALAQMAGGGNGCEVQVEVTGRFAVGGGDWSLVNEPALLLVAGGTGVFGWLPALALADANAAAGRQVHLVWCVKTEADYLALAKRLPPRRVGVQLTIFITRATSGSLEVGGHTAVAQDIESDGTPSSLDKSQGGDEEMVAGLLSRTQEIQEREWAALGSGGGSGSGGGDGQGEGGTSSSLALGARVSLFATFCALAVGYWGWEHVKKDLLESLSIRALISYTLCWRCFPIALILTSLVVATTLASHVLYLFSRKDPECTGVAASAEAGGDVDVDGDSDGERAQHEGISLLTFGTDCEDGEHGVRAGRPNLAALVRTAAATAATAAAPGRLRQRSASMRLVVAACGPAELVEAARNAVGAVRAEGCRVGICFSGTDTNW